MRKTSGSAEPPLVQKALLYINDVDFFRNDTDTAVSVLKAVYTSADPDLKDEIIYLLGSLEQPDICSWLYAILADPGEAVHTRYCAARQISVTAAFIKDTDKLNAQLTADLETSDPNLRRLAALALGWDGNQRAGSALAACLYDKDLRVRKNATVALSRLALNIQHAHAKEG
jgi:HEAT repeat protein